jgi:hypothetical protein
MSSAKSSKRSFADALCPERKLAPGRRWRAGLVLGVALGLLACAAPTVTSTERQLHGAATVATTRTFATARTEAPRKPATACLMLYECGCNSKCFEIDLPEGALRDGDTVAIASGDWKGKQVFAAANRPGLEAEFFTIQRNDPRAPVQICEGAQATPLMGYLCSSNGHGPAQRCQSCQEP